MQREQLQAAVVDFDVQAVDGLVADEYRVERRLIAIDQRPDGHAHAVFGQAAHFEQPRLERSELFLEVRDVSFHACPGRRYPKRPVT